MTQVAASRNPKHLRVGVGLFVIALFAAAVIIWGIPALRIVLLQRHLRNLDTHDLLLVPFRVAPPIAVPETTAIVDVGYCTFRLPFQDSIVEHRCHPVATLICTDLGILGMPSPVVHKGMGSDEPELSLTVAVERTGWRTFGELWRMSSTARDAYAALARAKMSLTPAADAVEMIETADAISLVYLNGRGDGDGTTAVDVFAKRTNLTCAVFVKGDTAADAVLLARTLVSSIAFDQKLWRDDQELYEARLRAALRLPGEWRSP